MGCLNLANRQWDTDILDAIGINVDLLPSVVKPTAIAGKLKREALEVITEITPVDQLLATGGGARSHLWLQILADILQPELIVPSSEEGAAYGAAILAMVGVGAYPNLEAAFEILSQDSNTVQPQTNAVYEEGFKRYKLLYEVLKAAR